LAELLVGDDDAQSGSINHEHVRRRQILVIVYLALNLDLVCLASYNLDVFVAVLEASRDSNALRSLNLVTRKHPDLDAGLSQRVDCLQHVLL
jgi:hypothetical protein